MHDRVSHRPRILQRFGERTRLTDCRGSALRFVGGQERRGKLVNRDDYLDAFMEALQIVARLFEEFDGFAEVLIHAQEPGTIYAERARHACLR
jgi:hypothetical protein